MITVAGPMESGKATLRLRKAQRLAEFSRRDIIGDSDRGIEEVDRMAVVLAAHSYGKSSVRLTNVTRRADRHDLIEWTVNVRLDGDFADSYSAGDNRKVVATDTMKNRVYVLASDRDFGSAEEFAIQYTGDFLCDYPQVEAATVEIRESSWQRIKVGGQPHPHAFVGGCAGQRWCRATQSRGRRTVHGGVCDLPILKSTDSSFRDFYRDQYTSLPDTDDRILGTLLTANWTYSPGDHDWNGLYTKIRNRLLEAFAVHHSLGVQHTLYDMGRAVLQSTDAVAEIELTMPNRHRVPFNLTPFERENANQIFVTTDEPFGVISARIKRES
jgi:urate oxidase